MNGTYRSKPVVVHATQWWKMGDESAVTMVRDYLANGGRGAESPALDTPTGKLPVKPGDWIIRDNGEVRLCEDHIFRAKYEPAAAPVAEVGDTEWEACEWQLAGFGPYTPLQQDIRIRLMRSPFYQGDRYSVRCIGNCLSKDGKWECEPMPSSRDDAFYARCRFDSFADAVAAVKRLSGPSRSQGG
jgi:hypothetical protein